MYCYYRYSLSRPNNITKFNLLNGLNYVEHTLMDPDSVLASCSIYATTQERRNMKIYIAHRI